MRRRRRVLGWALVPGRVVLLLLLRPLLGRARVPGLAIVVTSQQESGSLSFQLFLKILDPLVVLGVHPFRLVVESLLWPSLVSGHSRLLPGRLFGVLRRGKVTVFTVLGRVLAFSGLLLLLRLRRRVFVLSVIVELVLGVVDVSATINVVHLATAAVAAATLLVLAGACVSGPLATVSRRLSCI